MGYLCGYCGNQYLEPTELKKHTLETHQQDIHKAYFMQKIRLEVYLIKLDITFLQCKICDRNIDTLELFMEHLQIEHHKTIYTDIKNHILPFKFETEILKCCVCMTTFSKFKMLLEHMNLHYRNHICEICDVGFANFLSLKFHRRTHEIGSFQCNNCQQVFDTNIKMKAHVRTVHAKKRFNTCGYCNKTFGDFNTKELHMVSMHGLKIPTPKCQACNKVFRTRKSLSVHVKRDHLLHRPHKCSECDMSFFGTSELKLHMVKHTGVKSFKCTVCFKSFCLSKTLRQHMKIHNNVRRFKCEHCGLAFVQKCSWRGHLKSKHGEIV